LGAYRKVATPNRMVVTRPDDWDTIMFKCLPYAQKLTNSHAAYSLPHVAKTEYGGKISRTSKI